MRQCGVLAVPRYRTQAERELAEWAAITARRNEVIRAAFAAGVRKRDIFRITGISRTTIDTILGGEGT